MKWGGKAVHKSHKKKTAQGDSHNRVSLNMNKTRSVRSKSTEDRDDNGDSDTLSNRKDRNATISAKPKSAGRRNQDVS